MSFNNHYDKEIMWEYESTEGTDPGSASPYEFGYRTRTFGNFPSVRYNMSTVYRGSRDPSLRVMGGEPRASISFVPLNGLPFYWIYGSSSTTTGVHTLTGIDTGTLPSITTRFQTQNATENIRKSMTGTKAKNLNFTITNINQRMRMPAFIGLGLEGISLAAPTNTGDLTPQFPDSVEDMYFVDNNFVCDWDSSGDVVDYTSDIMEIKYICDTTNRMLPLVNQLFPTTVAEGNRVHQLQLEILRGGDTSIYDDYIAQNRSSTGKDLHVKIYNTASNYIDLAFSNVFIQEIVMNDANEQKDEKNTYVVNAFAESCVPSIKDGLTAATFYGE